MSADDGQTGREILVDDKQRNAERDALRNVRRALDDIENEERATARTARRMVIVAAVLVALFVALVLVLAGRSSEFKGLPLVIPQAPAR